MPNKRAINSALNKVSKGLSLYSTGMEELDRAIDAKYGVGLNDIVGEDEDRQDAVFAITEGISVDIDELMRWAEEKISETEEGDN